MEENAVETPSAAPPGAVETTIDAANQVDFSIIGLVLKADIVVQLVMIILLLASVWSWAIIFQKTIALGNLNRWATAFENRFWSGTSLDDLFDKVGALPREPMSAVFASAMREWRQSTGSKGKSLSAAGLQQRIERVMEATVNREMDKVERNMTFLASTGSVAPFIGLFGTVWGIMNSFQSIAAQKDTSLAVVAPGIAEALFATALGLLAAVPAVVAYNKFSREIDRYAGRLESFVGEFSSILSRRVEKG